MNVVGALFDKYALFARHRPALLMLLPALVGAIVLFPSLRSWWATLLAVTGTCGVSLALSEFAQAKGKVLEPRLIALWDGLPSVALLRHRDTRLDTPTKNRYKAFLQRVVPGLIFPDEIAETADPAGADEAYQSATRWLLSQTRDKRAFSLLFEWNISYGFRRNMRGLRPYGIAVSGLTLIVTALDNARIALRAGEVDDAHIVGSVVALAALWFWIAVVKTPWIEIAANAYARELLAACDRLDTPRGKSAAKIRAKAV